jgi:hypothetical protein
MPIKPRPREHAGQPEATTSEDTQQAGRNPMLQGLRKDVYDFVKRNPDCTRAMVTKGTGIRSSSATARIKELIEQGFLFEPGSRVRNSSGVMSKCLRCTSRMQGGKPLDKVRVELTLTIDCNGVYGVVARIPNGKPQQSHAVPIKHQSTTITAPHPDAYNLPDASGSVAVSRVSRIEVETYAGDIIDAEAITLEKD